MITYNKAGYINCRCPFNPTRNCGCWCALFEYREKVPNIRTEQIELSCGKGRVIEELEVV